MFGNFDGIENGGFHRLNAQYILGHTGIKAELCFVNVYMPVAHCQLIN